jgi:hypothetical protein
MEVVTRRNRLERIFKSRYLDHGIKSDQRDTSIKRCLDHEDKSTNFFYASHFRPIPQNRDIIYEYPLTETRLNLTKNNTMGYELQTPPVRLKKIFFVETGPRSVSHRLSHKREND